jgi:hypothetical protein
MRAQSKRAGRAGGRKTMSRTLSPVVVLIAAGRERSLEADEAVDDLEGRIV